MWTVYIGDAHIKYMLKYATKIDVVSHGGLSYGGSDDPPTQDFFEGGQTSQKSPYLFPYVKPQNLSL